TVLALLLLADDLDDRLARQPRLLGEVDRPEATLAQLRRDHEAAEGAATQRVTGHDDRHRQRSPTIVTILPDVYPLGGCPESMWRSWLASCANGGCVSARSWRSRWSARTTWTRSSSWTMRLRRSRTRQRGRPASERCAA